MIDDPDVTAELANLYAFLSRVIADPPDETSVERLSEQQFPAEASPQALQNGFELLRTWQSELDDPVEETERLRRVHTALFVGPRPKLQIYESWYAGDFLGKPLAAVKGSYRDLGIQPTDDLREEPDHAAVELAALEMLARDGDDDYRRAFLAAHGWWIPNLAEDVREKADHPLYEGVGWLIEGVIETDTYLLGLDLDDLSPEYQTPSSARNG